tara:strand:+ start:98 stop:2011 length:1914 start_codon:yes stop_codon:yes gene_type:complete
MAKNKQIVDILFPEGFKGVPSDDYFIKKIGNNTLTYRDAFIMEAKQKGINFSDADLEDAVVKQFNELLPDAEPTSAKTFRSTLVSFKNELDKNFMTDFDTEVDLQNRGFSEGKVVKTQALDGIVFNFAKGKKIGNKKIEYAKRIIKAPQARGTAKFIKVPKPEVVWPKIIEAAQEIAANPKYGPAYAKSFLLSAILPNRGADLTDIHITEKGAKSGTVTRPLLYKNSDGGFSIMLPNKKGRGQKNFPNYKLTEFLSNMVDLEYNDAVNKGRSKLFENITTAKLSSSIKDHFAPKMKEFEIIMGKPIVGYSGLRKIAASTIAMHPSINNPEIAVKLLGHGSDVEFVQTLSLTSAKHYISNIEGVGADEKVLSALRKYENLIADILNTEDINDIARNSGVKIANDTRVIELDSLEDTGARNSRDMTPEELLRLKERRDAQQKTYIAGQEAQVAEFESKKETSLLKAQETRQARQVGLEETPKKAINFNSDSMNTIINKYNIKNQDIENIKQLPIEEQQSAFSKILKKAKEGIKKSGPLKKPIAKGLGIAGAGITAAAVTEVATTPVEAYELEEDEKNLLNRMTETIGIDTGEERKAARILEETYSPLPITLFKRKGEETVPLEEQLKKLVPFGGIRGGS